MPADDAIEQALVEGFGQARWDAMNGAEQHDARELFGPMAVSIAARVRAEAVAEREAIIEVIRQYLPDALPFNTLPEIVGGIARQRDFQHELKDHLADVARRLTDERDDAVAEAVAGEGQRLTALIRNAFVTDHETLLDSYWNNGLRQALLIIGAGSVPVATPPRPEIVVLCGSTRFKDAFRDAAKAEALAGRIVLTVSDLDPRPEARHVNVPIDAETKARLDELHKRKIDLADRVLVLNVGGYVGESTRSEIGYATAHGKPISYLESGPRLQPERVGFGTDAFEAGGSLPGQPVAPPTEPADEWGAPCSCIGDELGNHDPACEEGQRPIPNTEPPASLVTPAVQPPTCTCANFPGLAGQHSPWCGNTTGPRFSITGALPPAGQPEER